MPIYHTLGQIPRKRHIAFRRPDSMPYFPTWTEPTTWADTSDLPVFKITCSKDAKPHPYLGRVLTTEVSEKGLDLVARGSAIAQSVVEGATSGLSDQEQDKLISLLGRCLVSMGVEPQPGTMD